MKDKAMENVELLHKITMQCKEKMTQNDFNYIARDILKLSKTLIPPTKEEVCKVLSEYYNSSLSFYVNKGFYYTKKDGSQILISCLTQQLVYFKDDLPPHLITMIGRFYEDLEAQNE